MEMGIYSHVFPASPPLTLSLWAEHTTILKVKSVPGLPYFCMDQPPPESPPFPPLPPYRGALNVRTDLSLLCSRPGTVPRLTQHKSPRLPCAWTRSPSGAAHITFWPSLLPLSSAHGFPATWIFLLLVTHLPPTLTLGPLHGSCIRTWCSSLKYSGGQHSLPPLNLPFLTPTGVFRSLQSVKPFIFLRALTS